MDNQKLINEYNDQLTKGTSIKNTDVSLVEGLFNENYLKADATTNITNKTDIYLDKDAQKNTVNLVTHEDAHQVGFGEKSSEALGWMGEAAFNVNSWVNSSNIDTAKTQIQNIPKVEVAGINDAQTQLNLLKANTEKYESQIANNDEFDEHLTNKRFVDLQKYLEICKSSPNANGCSQADKNKLVAKIKQISADNLSVYKSCKASGQSACMEKNVQQIWAAEQFDDNKLKQLLGSTNVGLASNYDVKAADPQLFKKLEFLQYAQKNCQGMSYGDCGTKYTVSHRSAAENILIPAKSKVLDYIVGEKPRSGASYYLAGIGYVATEILFPESGTDVALIAIGGAASRGASLVNKESKVAEDLVKQQKLENNANVDNDIWSYQYAGKAEYPSPLNGKSLEEIAKLENIKAPNPRHNGATVSPKSIVKENNTVVTSSVNMKQDTQLIKNGEATNLGKDTKTGDTLHSLPNGRVYAEKGKTGQLYPYSGPGIYQLDRGAYGALGVYNKFGKTEKAETILKNMNITPEARSLALKVFEVNVK